MSRYHGARHHKAKLSLEDVRAIRASKETGRVLAQRYGISRPQVYKIRGKQAWGYDP